jgi:RNA polymerase sigma-70 factor (ECF subfamily)
MEPTPASGVIAASLKDTAIELQDFDSVVQLYWPVVYRFALASLRDKDAAEVLAQDCFLRAYRNRNAFRGEARVKTWLMQIAVNLIRDQLRNRQLQFWRRAQTSAMNPHDLEDCIATNHHASPETQTLLNEQVRAIWEATEHLSPRQRSVFLLRFVEEMELAEIGEVLGMKTGTVKAHLFRALNTVRKRMGKQP